MEADACIQEERQSPCFSCVFPQEVSCLYPCLVTFARPDGGTTVSSTRCKRRGTQHIVTHHRQHSAALKARDAMPFLVRAAVEF